MIKEVKKVLEEDVNLKKGSNQSYGSMTAIVPLFYKTVTNYIYL